MRMAKEAPVMSDEKHRVAQYWNDRPCGSGLAGEASRGTAEFFERTEIARYQREPFITRFARFEAWREKLVLEVGCGTGCDLSMFARHGANVVGVDLTPNGAALAARRLRHLGLGGQTMVGDCERLPLADDMFDLVYSWGVIHHTPNTEQAAAEIMRVAKPGGRITVMIYNRRSLVALQAYLLYGVIRGWPRRAIAEIIATHLESPGTKAFTLGEGRQLFSSLDGLIVTPVVTLDLRIGRERFLPGWMCALVPRRLGYFMVIEGRKPY
jgi:ubiquinone/menaquinone biosynthesis C-methylase UbiE